MLALQEDMAYQPRSLTSTGYQMATSMWLTTFTTYCLVQGNSVQQRNVERGGDWNCALVCAGVWVFMSRCLYDVIKNARLKANHAVHRLALICFSYSVPIKLRSAWGTAMVWQTG